VQKFIFVRKKNKGIIFQLNYKCILITSWVRGVTDLKTFVPEGLISKPGYVTWNLIFVLRYGIIVTRQDFVWFSEERRFV